VSAGGDGRILVGGEALVDLVPDPVTRHLQPCPGGGPYNTAIALGRLGVPAAFVGRLSTDAFGRRLRAGLEDAGVDLDAVLTGSAPTMLAVVTLGSGGAENEYAFYVDATVTPDVSASDLPPLDGVAAVHVGTVALMREPVATSLELLATRAAGHVVVGLDPNVRPGMVQDREAYTARIDRLAAIADVVKLSDADAAWLHPDGTAEDLAERWRADGAGLVVVTRGPDGAVGFGAAGRVEVPSEPITVVDTVGAGDSFNAGLLAWLHDHGALAPAAVRALDAEGIAAALAFAGQVAARTCMREGADPPWRHELGGNPS
jgi:fructokinase